ncbi:hypothetical protein [Acidipropionibacterium acidipropionici]|uniref:hypothetical protein n=1 Tax=Acidipropionibacterium acidipropionici TaxID=1748 RepID=UPI00110B14E0|nr:hypothetical protein [Acidipropionibacterium acidipropionici]QCV95733.1 hypothetical protein FEZ30_11135 [Acidipropionibacterium acidipropionici]
MSTAKTSPISRDALVDKVRAMAPVWATGSVNGNLEGGSAYFTRSAFAPGLHGSVYLNRVVGFDPDTGEPVADGPVLDFIELEGAEGSTYWDLAELPALMRALAELAGAAGITAAQMMGASDD